MNNQKSDISSSPKAQRTKAILLEKAYELFKKKGFDATTMRDIAVASDMSLGSTYYYFETKESLVFEFYRQSLGFFEQRAQEIFSQSKDLQTRIRRLLASKLVELRPSKNFLNALTRTALDPNSKLSPFGTETGAIRERVVEIFRECVESSDTKLSSDLKRRLPLLLWLYHMGIIFLWMHDTSLEEKRTARVIEKSSALLMQFLKISNLPIIGSFTKPIFDLLDEFISNKFEAGPQ